MRIAGQIEAIIGELFYVLIHTIHCSCYILTSYFLFYLSKMQRTHAG